MQLDFRHLSCVPLAISVCAGLTAAREFSVTNSASAAPAPVRQAAAPQASFASPNNVQNLFAGPMEPVKLPRLIATEPRIATRLNQIRPSVKQRLLKALSLMPDNHTLLITSAHRTHDEQAGLVSTFGVKARPGTSTHEDGRAVDLNLLVNGERVPPRIQQRYIGQAMKAAGFFHLGAIDPVHYSVPVQKIDESDADVALEVMTYDQWTAVRESSVLTQQASAGNGFSSQR